MFHNFSPISSTCSISSKSCDGSLFFSTAWRTICRCFLFFLSSFLRASFPKIKWKSLFWNFPKSIFRQFLKLTRLIGGIHKFPTFGGVYRSSAHDWGFLILVFPQLNAIYLFFQSFVLLFSSIFEAKSNDWTLTTWKKVLTSQILCSFEFIQRLNAYDVEKVSTSQIRLVNKKQILCSFESKTVTNNSWIKSQSMN